MSLVQDVKSKYSQLFTSVGQAGVNALWNNDFEYYMIALELVDSTGLTIDYLSFPVNPTSISQSESSMVNIKKTAGGIVSLNTTTFVPKTIQIKGNFGRMFRVLLSNKSSVNFSAFKFGGSFSKEQLQNNFNVIKQAAFDPSVKSGYGATKYLQAIINKASMIDDNGNPFKLFFYNPILGNNYLVEPIDFELSESMESNRIPQYNIQLRAIAPLDSMKSVDLKKSMINNLTSNLLQKGANQLANNIRRALR